MCRDASSNVVSYRSWFGPTIFVVNRCGSTELKQVHYNTGLMHKLGVHSIGAPSTYHKCEILPARNHVLPDVAELFLVMFILVVVSPCTFGD